MIFLIYLIQIDNPLYTKTQGNEILDNKDNINKSQKLTQHSQTTQESEDTHDIKSIDGSVIDLDTSKILARDTQTSSDKPDMMTVTSTDLVTTFQPNEEVIMHAIIQEFNF